MTAFIETIFKRGKVAILALVVLSMMGISTYRTAPKEADPDIPLPFVQIIIPLPGVSPQDAERLLIRPVEAELQSLEGLVQSDAMAFDGAGQLLLEFEVGMDMDQVVTDVREAVKKARGEFPAATREPQIEELNAQSMMPIMTVVLYGDAPERALFDASKQLEDALRGLPGVLDIETVGARDEVVEIEISPAELENHGLSPLAVANAIHRNNTLVTAGNLRFSDGGYAVKVPGLFKSLDDIRSISLATSDDTVLTVGDLATVRRTFEEPTGYARFNGRLAIGLDITKRGDVNLIELTKAIRAETAAVAETWPETMSVAYIGDLSNLVNGIFTSLTSSILLAIILVMIIVVAALGLRSALLVGIAIPSSFLIGFALIGFFGFTLNNLVMFSMVLAVGMLVDGAIVVVEYADRRMAEGARRQEAFIEASARMFWPIVASTATTLAAFVPFLFWNSIEGYFMRWIPITLILVLSSSLVVALIFLPIIGASLGLPHWLKARFGVTGQAEGREQIDLDNVDPTSLQGPTGVYARVIARLVNRPIVVMIGTVIIIVGSITIFSISKPEVEQFLRADFEQVQIYVEGRGNISDREALEVTTEVQNIVITHPAVEFAYLQTGPQVSRGDDAPIDAIALINLDLVPYKDRKHSLEVVEELREQTAGVPGVKVEVRQPEQGPPVGKDVQVELSAPNYSDAQAAGRLIRAYLEGHNTDAEGIEIPSFMDIEDNQPLPGIEWEVVPDRAEAGRYGVTVSEIGAAIQLVTEGLIVDTYRPDDSEEELDIRLRYTDEARKITNLSQINIPTAAGLIPISNFATRKPVPLTDRVIRRDGRRVLDVLANANTAVKGHEISQNEATAVVEDYLASDEFRSQISPTVTWRLHGAAEKTAQSAVFFQGAMAAAMIMIGVILLLQFNSYYHAFLTLSAVVLSVVGVLLGVALSGQYISVIMTGVGIVALAGIVVNNNIVLIDTFHALREQGLDPREAATRTAAQRLRPVLLTTVTTIIGLLPMVFQIDIDFGAATVGIGNETSDWWVLLSSAIVFGLAFATLLTLVLTPVMLAAPYTLSEHINSLRGRNNHEPPFEENTEPTAPPTIANAAE